MWSLVLASVVSALVVGARWVRTREVSTLGALVGLRLVLGVAVVSVAALTAPLTVAVVLAQVVPLPVLLGLITWTQVRGRRLDREARSSLAAAADRDGGG